jgi:hypothetical protein
MLLTRNRVGRFCAALSLGIGFPAACNSTPAVNGESACSLNSDCAVGLACALGKCREPCTTAVDCPGAGASCVDDGRNAVCQSPEDKNTPCARPSDCPVPMACASDYRCRNLCFTDADCNVLGITGRMCAADANGVDYCADPSEVALGKIVATPPPGAPTTPVVEPAGLAASDTAAKAPGASAIASNVGEAGGTLGIGDVTMSVPAGALGQSVVLTISPLAFSSTVPEPAGVVGPAYEIGPSGTMFAQPVTIAFSYTDAALDGLPPSDFAVETIGADGSWTPLSQIVVDVYAHTIAGQTTHLSPYALVSQIVTISDGAAAMSDAGADATAQPQYGGDASASGDGAVEAGSDAAASVDASLGEAGACPAPNVPSLANSNAASTNTRVAGTTFVAADGYATLTNSVQNSPAAGTVYSASLVLTFTNYPNASGYYTASLEKAGSELLVVTPPALTSARTTPRFTTQQYPMDTAVIDVLSSTCPTAAAQGTCALPAGVPGLMISNITATEVMGTVVGTCASTGVAPTGDQVSVSFDVPLFTLGADGGAPIGAPCCVP